MPIGINRIIIIIRRKNKFVFACFLLILINTISGKNLNDDAIHYMSKIDVKPFGLVDGKKINLYTITNINQIEIKVTNYGGIITSLKLPDKNGIMENVVIGFDSLDGYLDHPPYFGAIIGRFANRIAKGNFNLDGKNYQLATNNNENHLHGGIKGFDKVVWSAAIKEYTNGVELKLSYKSPAGEEGYPGNLFVDVTYKLDNNNSLHVEYKATTDEATIINLTQHSYFNLSGDFTKNIENHELTIFADTFLPVDETLIPTGELKSVLETPFDFRKGKIIGEQILENDIQLIRGLGYDHCWIINQSNNPQLKHAATLYEPGSGRIVEVHTTEPGIQFYSGNFLDGSIISDNGIKYNKRAALCLETQHFPDSPNQTEFPSVVLRPGENFYSLTRFDFNVLDRKK